MPIGDGEVLQLSAQSNASYYQSYSAQYSTNWFGGRRPIQFSVGAFFSKQTDVSSNYYNSSSMYKYYNYMYGYGKSRITIITRTTTTPTSTSNSMV